MLISSLRRSNRKRINIETRACSYRLLILLKHSAPSSAPQPSSVFKTFCKYTIYIAADKVEIDGLAQIDFKMSFAGETIPGGIERRFKQRRAIRNYNKKSNYEKCLFNLG